MPSVLKDKFLYYFRWINSSIYYRFNFAMTSLTLSILLVIGLLSFGLTRHIIVQNILHTIDSDTVHDSQEFEHLMNLISESLINISTNLIITNAIVDTAGRNAYIGPFMKSLKLPNDISVMLTLCDFMGSPLASNVRNPREFNSPELLQRTIEEGIGFVELTKNGNETGLLMALPVIWVMTHKPEGILVAEISMDELFAKTLNTFKIGKDRSISLLSANTPLLQKNKKNEVSFFQLIKPLHLSPPLDKLSFQIEINDYREIKTGWIVGFFCVAGVFFISVSIVVSKKISFILTDRLMILCDATKRISESGALDFTVEVKGFDEVTVLAIAFNEMINKVREAQDSLKIRVEELRSVTQRLKLSTQSANLGIWDWDITNNNMIWDDRMLELYGLTRETFSGGLDVWQNALHPEDRGKVIEECQASLRGECEWNTDFRILQPDGTLKYIKANGIVIWDSEGIPQRMLGINFDITDRKLVEEELLHLNKTLEHRVAQEVDKNLEHERLLIHQSRLAAMGEMIGNIAHQWRQPLNALGLLIYNIKDAYQFNTLDAAYLDQAVADGRRLVNKMSTTISDFANFFRPDKEIQIFSALEQIREAIALVASSFQHSNISIHIDASQDIKLMGFPNEYSQVLLNLISNAKEAILLHTQKLSGRVDITLSAQDGQGCVSVRDNGGGIPDEILDRIFEPYFSTKEKGSGIGLYMSKMIIERNMRGSITAKNIESGAEFIVCAPFTKDSPYEPS